MTTEAPRRPLKSRQSRWAAASAETLARWGVWPNQISLASVVFAAGAGLLFWLAPGLDLYGRTAAYVGAAFCIQFRLICNLLDGMVAVEGGRRSRSGEIWNDMPDRFSDVFILAPAGYTLTAISWGPELGWTAAVLAVLTAYVRLLGGSAGLKQEFTGPMAKPQRMAVMTIAALASAVECWIDAWEYALTVALFIVAAGSLLTVIRRTVRIVQLLET